MCNVSHEQCRNIVCKYYTLEVYFPLRFKFVDSPTTETQKVVLSSTVSTMIFSTAEAVPLTIYGGLDSWGS